MPRRLRTTALTTLFTTMLIWAGLTAPGLSQVSGLPTTRRVAAAPATVGSPSRHVDVDIAPSDLRDKVRAYRQSHEREILKEFASFLAIPNRATDAGNIERNAALITGMLESRGIRTYRLESGDAPPIVCGELNTPGATQTVTFYAHYDGQPVDPKQWQGDPFTP
ncbi:MAG TPA: hypothetical protein VEZ90_05240, partial [Blastocatellia bacterium]|nr:hypothetical protein [Blastocatellia bacterium]